MELFNRVYTSGDRTPLRQSLDIVLPEPTVPELVEKLRQTLTDHEGTSSLSLSGRERLAGFVSFALPPHKITNEVQTAVWKD